MLPDKVTRLALYYYYYSHVTVIYCNSADQSENFSQTGMFRDRQVGGGGAMHGSKMKECQVVCQLLLHWWCWRLSDWPPLRPTTTSAEQTRPVFAVLCRQSNQLHNPLRGILLISLRGVLTEEAAAAASISAILQVFRT